MSKYRLVIDYIDSIHWDIFYFKQQTFDLAVTEDPFKAYIHFAEDHKIKNEEQALVQLRNLWKHLISVIKTCKVTYNEYGRMYKSITTSEDPSNEDRDWELTAKIRLEYYRSWIQELEYFKIGIYEVANNLYFDKSYSLNELNRLVNKDIASKALKTKAKGSFERISQIALYCLVTGDEVLKNNQERILNDLKFKTQNSNNRLLKLYNSLANEDFSGKNIRADLTHIASLLKDQPEYKGTIGRIDREIDIQKSG